MRLYLRKIFEHDITHEVSVKIDIVKDFFPDKNFKIKGKKSNFEGEVNINNATDPRFGGEFKQILKKEGGIEENNLIVIYRINNKYELEIIENNDKRYSTYFSLFNKLERHVIITLDKEKEYEEDRDLQVKEYEEGRNFQNKEYEKSRTSQNIGKHFQRIFFGAPGTGKSYKLNEEAKKYFRNNYERVTFHPSYVYGNFVGSFKPFLKTLKTKDNLPKEDEDGNIKEIITYEYVPGALIKQLVKALKNPKENYLLIIEEINRANVATVFGDIFQLLDRNTNGESEYFITTSKELQDFLVKEFRGCKSNECIKEKLGENYTKLYFPNNLYIWATMNSADQGVMPMDTAFRRRWEFEYLGIDTLAEENKEEFEKYEFKINSEENINWNEFRKEINKRLSSLNVPEDKLIGPYFISKSILSSKDIDKLTETIKNKVLMYLYEDVAKAIRGSLFADGKYSTYSDLCKYFDEDPLNLFKSKLNIVSKKIK